MKVKADFGSSELIHVVRIFITIFNGKVLRSIYTQ